MDRKFLPTFSELIDRLSIHQLKEVFIPEHKDKYAKEMDDIIFDLEGIIEEQNVKIDGELIRAIIVLAQINLHIWHNETKVRAGTGGESDLHLLKLTHGLNGIRNRAQNMISTMVGQSDRMDWKTDCLAEEFKDWEVTLFKGKEKQPDERRG